MDLKQCNTDTTIIGILATEAEQRGLTEQEFKDKFDEFGKTFVKWFNEVHLPDVKEGFTEVNESLNVLNDDRGYLTYKNVLNFNDAKENGFYAGYNLANAPIINSNFTVVVNKLNDTCSQLAICTWSSALNKGKTFIRTYDDSSWQPWQEIATTETYTPTLLNGWQPAWDDPNKTLKATRVGNTITVSGGIQSGVITEGTTVCNIAELGAFSSSHYIYQPDWADKSIQKGLGVSPDGDINILNWANNAVCFFNFSFVI